MRNARIGSRRESTRATGASGVKPFRIDHPAYQTSVGPTSQVGTDAHGPCSAIKFAASPPDARSLTGSATWSCTYPGSSFTATLTWDLAASP
jgi:hypothetical protein